ncbi:MAG: amidohydrolase [Rhodospirillaceae bacterium BRH_c57]|nr:MAG: amidohydrolase [Rhodospirillaceae bacterium BRH_c57]
MIDAPFTAACIQVNASNDMDANIAEAVRLTRQARAEGAHMVFMPENVTMMEWGRSNIVAKARTEADHPGLKAFRALAQELGLWLHCGTLSILLAGERIANRTYVVSPDGEIAARYDKIHMFDVDLGNGESYRESATFQPGVDAVVVSLPWGGLGLSVCYDIRFPALYRTLAKAGASFLTIPAAFTRVTGQAHWHVLQRARAIETGCYVISPAQTGTHINDRQTYGHAMIVDPWGEVLADAGTDPGIILAEIDPRKVAEVRGKVPSLTHDRPFGVASERL